AYPEKLTDRLVHWATVAPERIFLAQRKPDRTWRSITYGVFYSRIRRIGESLLRRKLSVDRPVAILSGDDIEQALLMFAAMHVGIPSAPISPSYSLRVKEFSRLNAILDALRPGMIFANSLNSFSKALQAVSIDGVELVTSADCAHFVATSFNELESSNDS